MLVKATGMSLKLNVGIKELHRIATPGEVFEVTPLRYEVLSGKNKYKAVFVTLAKEEKVEEPVKAVDEEPVTGRIPYQTDAVEEPTAKEETVVPEDFFEGIEPEKKEEHIEPEKVKKSKKAKKEVEEN